MQTRVLGLIGSRSALALLWVASGSVALAQAGPTGTSGSGSTDAVKASKFAEMKVTIDTDRGRLVEVVPPLLKSVGADYVIDAEVKNAVVSSHLTNVKLQTVLDALLRGSSIPVQVTFEKGTYRFSKKTEKVEAPPESHPPIVHIPGESVLPPPPTTQDDEIDIHNVQTFDLLRVLNGLSSGSASPSAFNGNGSISGYSASSGSGISANGLRTGGGSAILGGSGSGNSSQNAGGGLILHIFGHPVRIPGR
jgi:hypothetical protein